MPNLEVLLVEDEVDIQTLFEVAIGESFNNVKLSKSDTVKGVREFLSKIGQFDIVFIDGNLPDGNTVELVSEIRKNTSFKGIIVAMSGNPDIQEKLMEMGCNVSLPKPFPVEKFLEIITKKLVEIE